jgi:hypothetical protein
VLPVDVRLRAFLARLVSEPADDHVVQLGEDAQGPFGPVGGGFALAWP